MLRKIIAMVIDNLNGKHSCIDDAMNAFSRFPSLDSSETGEKQQQTPTQESGGSNEEKTSAVQEQASGGRASRIAAGLEKLQRILAGGGLSKSETVLLIGAFVYCTFPVDLIPDNIGWSGYVDDLLVIVATVAYFWKKSK